MESNYREDKQVKNFVMEVEFKMALKKQFNIPTLGLDDFAYFIDQLATKPDVDLFEKLKWSDYIAAYAKCRSDHANRQIKTNWTKNHL